MRLQSPLLPPELGGTSFAESHFSSHRFAFVFLCLALCSTVLAQAKMDSPNPPPLSQAEGEKQARILLEDLLSRAPEKGSTNTGEVRIRNADRSEKRVSVKFEIFSTTTNWVSTYETTPAGASDQNAMKLTVVHAPQGNHYFLIRPFTPVTSVQNAVRLKPDQLAEPFVGSDFWIMDLGLEFLRWPNQRVIKGEMRRSMPCKVLESINPEPAPGSYSRVVSWIDPESGGIVHADAYDPKGNLMKLFDPTGLEKINGIRQLEEMEMRNRQTKSHTWIKFNLR